MVFCESMMFFFSTGEESFEAQPTKMRAFGSSWAITPWSSSKHSEARCCTVQQSSSAQPESKAYLRKHKRAEENPRNQSRAGQCTGRVYQHHQQLLPWRDCQILLAWLLGSAAGACGDLSTATIIPPVIGQLVYHVIICRDRFDSLTKGRWETFGAVGWLLGIWCPCLQDSSKKSLWFNRLFWKTWSKTKKFMNPFPI